MHHASDFSEFCFLDEEVEHGAASVLASAGTAYAGGGGGGKNGAKAPSKGSPLRKSAAQPSA